MKSTNIRDLTPSRKYDPDMFFNLVLIEKNKSGKMGPQKIWKNIAFIPLNEFFDYISCAKEDAVCWSFRVNKLIGKAKRGKQIQAKKNTLCSQVL